MRFEVAEGECSECGKIKKLSFDKGKNIRHTYCMKCGFAVIWKRLETVRTWMTGCEGTWSSRIHKKWLNNYLGHLDLPDWAIIANNRFASPIVGDFKWYGY